VIFMALGVYAETLIFISLLRAVGNLASSDLTYSVLSVPAYSSIWVFSHFIPQNPFHFSFVSQSTQTIYPVLSVVIYLCGSQSLLRGSQSSFQGIHGYISVVLTLKFPYF
jgi:hypothetical protein